MMKLYTPDTLPKQPGLYLSGGAQVWELDDEGIWDELHGDGAEFGDYELVPLIPVKRAGEAVIIEFDDVTLKVLGEAVDWEYHEVSGNPERVYPTETGKVAFTPEGMSVEGGNLTAVPEGLCGALWVPIIGEPEHCVFTPHTEGNHSWQK